MKRVLWKRVYAGVSWINGAIHPKSLFFAAIISILPLVVNIPAMAQGRGQGSAPSGMLKDLLDSAQGLAAAGHSEPARFTLDTEGFVRYLGAAPGKYFPVGGSPDPDVRSRAFLERWGGLFYRATPNSGYETVRVKTEGRRSYVRLQQLYAGLQVFGAQIVVQLDASRNVTNVHSDIMRDFATFERGRIGLTPTLSADEARVRAMGQVLSPGSQGTSSDAKLMIYSPAVVGAKGSSQLVWQTIVEGISGLLLKEMVLVNAHTGEIALRYPLIHNAKNRAIYDSANTYADPGTLCRAEGGPVSSVLDCNQAYDYFGDTYDFYYDEHGRDSFDSAGGLLSATVRYCHFLYGCPMANAFWDEVQERMYFGDGFCIDDVIAHELTHGVTSHESNLIYSYQSGAINESLSDVWGEFVDLTNGAGTDTSEVRWLMGEDVPDHGAIRDMADPTAFGDPDRMGSTLYYCGSDDNGGVHYNSGVSNKLCYLMTDGDTFNGRTVNAMGISKVADLYYECQVNLLTDASDYLDLYNALTQAAINLGFTQAERDNIEEACLAVEINSEPPCGSLVGCEGYCGEISPDGCGCDELCYFYGDCCPDKCDFCPGLFCGTGGCEGYCGGESLEGCWCDEFCHTYGDCCLDKCDFCPSPSCPSDCLVTISPPTASVYTFEEVQFAAAGEGTCNTSCYTWSIVAQESTGSVINANGLYTAGGNAGTDIVQVTDACNGGILDTATVNVIEPPGCIVPCAESESGSLNIVETSGKGGGTVTVTVGINGAPNAADALGFEVAYKSDCLAYTGFSRGSCMTNWSYVDMTNPSSGVLRIGAFTAVDPVVQGESCEVVRLNFTITTPDLDTSEEALQLNLQSLVDDIAGWSTSPGYICGGCSCDINGDGIPTPQDALCAFQKYLGICPTQCGTCNAVCGDINSDGITTPADALCIFQEYLGIGCSDCS